MKYDNVMNIHKDNVKNNNEESSFHISNNDS